MPKIYFYIQHLYYLPQFLPVFQQLLKHRVDCLFIFNQQNTSAELIHAIAEKEKLKTRTVRNDYDCIEIYKQDKPDWIVFGNAFPLLKEIPPGCRTALLYHGIGIKECYYDKALSQMNIRFTEGPYRTQELRKRYPDIKVYESGFAKLDPLVNSTSNREEQLKKLSLDPRKKTILYAPTFYPSSIENMHIDWPSQFSDFNIIIKPHQFSLSNPRYKKQLTRINNWREYENVYVTKDMDYSLLPFMDIADILISEASSALFEFAALNRPVIWCDFIRLRWNYRGIFKYRYHKRMDSNILRYQDIARHVKKYRNLKAAIENELEHPENFQQQRQQYSSELLGNLDGNASRRICEFLLKEIQ